jgi:hypothetical protein
MEVLELYSGLMEKTVAVKKLSEAKTQGHQEFIAEMETLEKVKHQNLVPLLGYCSFDEENLLVYEYMVNGSLDLLLRNRTGALEVLDWDKRLNIATGAARGLPFLHQGYQSDEMGYSQTPSNHQSKENFDRFVRTAACGLGGKPKKVGQPNVWKKD